ncbi:germination protein YpeB [Brevibacillus humidisoli]|uniref:germination protein YpeB n=1 Tax=Brevibacillus humidisoli TaxID=2895522 RepID=UPI001E3F08A4|nr:germination protein YpeB [Brevibacillus humidisoli]UFJ42809.1 germination protein YpeB [Brevibacillus humidisoli]
MVYGVVSRVLFPVAVVALVGAGVWGYQEHNEKNSILIKAENQYQRAFHDLSYSINKLNDELGKSLVINSQRQATPCLTNVWRLAYQAQSDVGQLPLTLMPFNNTEEFLAKVADFSYGVAVRDLNKQPLSDQEYNTLKSLYNHSKEIQQQLQHVQTKVIDKQLRWMDVETTLASDDKKSDNTIIDGFRTIDRQVQEFDEVDWGVSIQNLEKKKTERMKGLSGRRISKQEAEQIARRFLSGKQRIATIQGAKVEVDENGKGETYNAYSVRFTPKDGKDTIHLDVTKRGGKVVWLLNERDVEKPKLTLAQAETSAQKFLQAHGYGRMVAAETDAYQGLGVFTFVPQQNGVRIYPDAVTVKVALDDGNVVGFHAAEYLYNHKQRALPKPKLTAQQARQRINPRLQVNQPQLALIEGKRDGKEVLCYEFQTKFEDNVYMIYINALTGEEEEIVKMAVENLQESV